MKMFRLFWAAATLVTGLSLARAAADLSGLNVFPNPVRTTQGQSTLTFGQLTPFSQVRIYDAQGVLVREVSLDGAATLFVWDLTNDAGRPVAGGVYIYRVSNAAGEKRSGKVAVIR